MAAKVNSSCTKWYMDDTIADLYYIMEYAAFARKQLQAGQSPSVGGLNRMAELASKVQQQFDPQLEEWCNNAETRRRNGSF